MSDFGILRELIKPGAIIEPNERKDTKYNIVLQETDTQNPYQVKINNIPGEILAFKPDKFPDTSNYFRNRKGECKRADFVIIINGYNKNWILYIEMKSGKGCPDKIVKQLKGAECMTSYFRSIGRKFWNTANFLKKEEYNQRFISIRNVRINKQPTTFSGKRKHDSPENMMTYRSPSKGGIQFSKLI